MKRSDYFNLFLQATVATLRHFHREIEVGYEKPVKVKKETVKAEFGVCLDFFGELQGRVLYEMDSETAYNIARLMDYKGYDKLEEKQVCSSIKELGNLITARTTLGFEKEGLEVDISPPYLVDGKTDILREFKASFIRIPLKTSEGDIDICIAVKN